MTWAVVGKEDISAVSGGLNRYVSGFATGLSEKGIQYELHFADGPSGKSRFIHKNRLGIMRILKFFWAGFHGAKRITIVDVHFSMYGLPFWLGVLSRHKFSLRRPNKPLLLVHFHGPWADESKSAGQDGSIRLLVKKTFDMAILKMASQVIVLSNTFRVVAEEVAKRPLNIKVVPPGLNDIWFTQLARPSRGSVLNIICVRRFTARMGLLEVLELLEELNFETSGGLCIKLHLVGSGDLSEPIQNWINERGRNLSVKIHNQTTDLELLDLYSKSNIALVPTKDLEGFGLVVLEAMALGRPVVSTGQGGLKEALGPWAETKLIFDLDSAESLDGALEYAASINESEVESLGLVEYARQFSWSSAVDQIILALGSSNS